MIPLYRDGSGRQPLAADRLAITYNGITFNSPSEAIDDCIEVSDVTETPMSDAIVELKQGRDGSEAYEVYRSGVVIRIRGFLKSPTMAGLMDKMGTVAGATDPATLSRKAQSSTLGFLNLGFSVPTADTANYATGLVSSFYTVRPMAPMRYGRTKLDGLAIPFSIDFFARDPRRYFITQQSVTETGTGTTLPNTLATYPSWPTTRITATGAGPAAYSIANTSAWGGTKTLTLDLSTLVNLDVVRVYHERRYITKNNVTAMNLYVSGQYYEVEPGVGNVTTRTANGNLTNVYDWYRAFAV